MKHPIQIKGFKLKGSNYYCTDGKIFFRKRTSLEDYILQQLKRGYIIVDKYNYGPKMLFLYSIYEPEKAKAIIESDGKGAPLSKIKKDDMNKV